MDQTIVTLIGAGRDRRTRALRRANRFQRRVIRMGEYIVIRPGRRIPAKIVMLRPHFPAMKTHMATGVLHVMYESKLLTFDELMVLADAKPELTEEEAKAAAEAAAKAASAAEAAAKAEAEAAAEEEAKAEAAAEAAAAETERENTDPEPPAGEEGTEEETAAVEATEETETGEEADAGETDAAEASELDNDDVADGEPEDGSEPEDAADGARPARSLPDGWATRSNSKLIKLHATVGLEVPADTRKQSLISSLTAWVEG